MTAPQNKAAAIDACIRHLRAQKNEADPSSVREAI
jgi:hypothetical protein